MSYRNLIRQSRHRMSKSFAKLADFLLNSYTEASFMTATQLAAKLDLDAATVVRFSQSLGYSGYPELLNNIRQHVRRDLLIRPQRALEADSIAGIVDAALTDISLSIRQTQISLSTQAVKQLVENLHEARRIVVLAEGPAQPAAYNLVHHFEQGNYPIFIARSGVSALARTVHTAKDGDVIVAIDINGENPSLSVALKEAQAKGITTAAIVGSPALATARYADIVLSARSQPSLGVTIVSIEAIIHTVIEASRWRYAERFVGAEQAIDILSKRIIRASGKD
ncbi:MAG: MurR/RpiR family transcriptional regulator [Anaerolineales bacterium]|jgi:DNA-binding MurR/RpiR family transcriptional regulator